MTDKNFPTISITIRSFDQNSSAMQKIRDNCDIRYINNTGKHLSEQGLIAAIHDVEGVIAGTENYSKGVLSAAKHLKAISRVGVGLDSIDLETASKKGVKVLNTPLPPVQSVAEHTLALLLSVQKHIPSYNENMRRHEYSITPSNLLYQKTVGILGLGRGGYRVAEMLNHLGCFIIFYDPYLSFAPPTQWRRVGSLDDLLEQSDIITLHAAAQSGHTPLLDESAFKKCRRGVIIINTARGSLINEDALINALNENIVAAAGLDVFNHEPYNGPLLQYSQVIITPHVASNTFEARRAMESEAVDNLIMALGGSNI